jgi:tetratricopeptide (TPR) repeat protein
MVAATAYFFNKQLDLFEREAGQAIALAPYDGEILAVLGYLIASSGQWERGIALAQKANALNADAAIGWYQCAMYYDYYLKGDYERALEFRRLHPDQHAIYTYIEYIPVGPTRPQGGSAQKLANVARGGSRLDSRELPELVPFI